MFHGHYTDLKLAIISCSIDHECINIVDEGCDGESPFHLCKKIRIDGWRNIPNKCKHSTRKIEGT